MACPNQYVLLNYNPCVFFQSAITATRFAHHNIDTLPVVEETEKL